MLTRAAVRHNARRDPGVTAAEAVSILLAGVAAGTINTVVGSGTLVTFPVLLSAGYAPIVANVSSGVGLVPGSISGALGYRRELAGQRRRVLRLGVASAAGGLTGGALLLVLPDEAFEAIVPVFILLALALIVFQPRLAARMAARRRRRGAPEPGRDGAGGAGTRAAVYGTGIYGGYFGAAQGIMLIAVLGAALGDDLQRINALKNVLAGIVNLVSGALFVLVADVAWEAAGLIAAGSIAGGQIGARYGRRLPAPALRAVVAVVGLTAVVQLLVR